MSARIQLRIANTYDEHEIPLEGEPLWDDAGRRLGFWNPSEQAINWFRIPRGGENENYTPEYRWEGSELSFRLPNGEWGPAQNLIGPRGDFVVAIPITVGDETTPLTVGNGKTTFRTVYPLFLSSVRASLTTAQVSGSNLTIDVKFFDGTTWESLFLTPITFNNGSRTSVNALTQSVLNFTDYDDDTEMRVDILQIGNGTAAGLKLNILGNQQ